MVTLFLWAVLATPAQAPDAAVALQTVQAAAILLYTTPTCVPVAGKAPVCTPSLSAADLKIVKAQIATALVAMKKLPATARNTAAEALSRVQQRLGSVGYERLHAYIFAASVVVGPPDMPHKTGADGKPVTDDQ